MTNKKLTILHKGKTEEDVMEMLDNNNVKYEFNFNIKNNASSISFVSNNKTYIYCFENNECIKVLTNN